MSSSKEMSTLVKLSSTEESEKEEDFLVVYYPGDSPREKIISLSKFEGRFSGRLLTPLIIGQFISTNEYNFDIRKDLTKFLLELISFRKSITDKNIIIFYPHIPEGEYNPETLDFIREDKTQFITMKEKSTTSFDVKIDAESLHVPRSLRKRSDSSLLFYNEKKLTLKLENVKFFEGKAHFSFYLLCSSTSSVVQPTIVMCESEAIPFTEEGEFSLDLFFSHSKEYLINLICSGKVFTQALTPEGEIEKVFFVFVKSFSR